LKKLLLSIPGVKQVYQVGKKVFNGAKKVGKKIWNGAKKFGKRVGNFFRNKLRWCYAPHTPILMNNGLLKKAIDVKIGDKVLVSNFNILNIV